MSLSDEEKMRILEKRILRLEQVIARGAAAQYLFCPSLNCWLPGQCDDEGRQVIDPSDLDARYLKVDGSNKMLADLTLDRSAHLMPYENKTSNIGKPSRLIGAAYIDATLTNNIQTELISMVGAVPVIGFQPDDFVLYDLTNDRYLFYIGSVIVGYIDDAGWHNGAPPP